MDEQETARILSERLGIFVDKAVRKVTEMIESIKIACIACEEMKTAMERFMQVMFRKLADQAERCAHMAVERDAVRMRRPFLERRLRAEIRWAESRRFYRRIYRPPRWEARGAYI